MTRRPTYKELEQRVKKLTNETLERDRMEKEVERIFNFSIDMIGSGNLQGYFTKTNSSFVEILGYLEKEILENPFIKFVHDDDVEKTKQALADAAKGKKEIYIENRYKCKDGSYKWIEWKVLSIVKENKFFAVGRDITKRKRTEESLRKKTHDLDERVKELNCLYGISKIRERPDIAFEEMLQEIVGLIPSSWRFPEITCARIIIEGQEYKTKNFKETVWKQTSNIVVHGKRSGILEICYLEEKPESDEGPFLKEERSLINAITERLGRVTEHKRAEKALHKAHDELERRVKKRTKELEIKKKGLEEINTAMTVLLKKREEDKIELEDNVLTNVKELVEPYFEKIKKTKLDDHQEAFLSIIESNLKEIISPFTRKMSLKYLNLTPTEIRIANLIRHGSSSKKIAELQNVSPRTIDTHRKNIRRKIGIQGQRGNLRSHLLSLH
jgi:PAS domain S-box-containing protein